MANAGRPTKINDEKIKTALKLAEAGKTIQFICDFLEINKVTYYNWCNEYPKLKKLIDEKKREAERRELEAVRKSLVKRAKGYKTKEVKEIYDGNGNKTGKVITTKEVPGDVKAQITFLTNVDPENWKVNPDETKSDEHQDNTLHLIID